MTTKTTSVEYIIREATGVYWPGILSYRDASTRVGRGYRTEEEAWDRAARVNAHYNANFGRGLDLRVEQREVK